jgi:hypothetical protein
VLLRAFEANVRVADHTPGVHQCTSTSRAFYLRVEPKRRPPRRSIFGNGNTAHAIMTPLWAQGFAQGRTIAVTIWHADGTAHAL